MASHYRESLVLALDYFDLTMPSIRLRGFNLAMSYLSGKLGSLRRCTAEYIWQQFFGGGSAPRLPFPRAATSLKSCYIGPLFLSNLLILYSIDTVCLADLALNNKVAVLLCAHRSPYVV